MQPKTGARNSCWIRNKIEPFSWGKRGAVEGIQGDFIALEQRNMCALIRSA